MTSSLDDFASSWLKLLELHQNIRCVISNTSVKPTKARPICERLQQDSSTYVIYDRSHIDQVQQQFTQLDQLVHIIETNLVKALRNAREQANVLTEPNVMETELSIVPSSTSSFKDHLSADSYPHEYSLRRRTQQSYKQNSESEFESNEAESDYLESEADSENSLDAGWAVEKVVDHRIKHETKQYLVKWSGYFPFENTWEDVDAVEEHAPETVREYEAILRKRQGTMGMQIC
ncbi:hypothetical protein ABG067_005261 [Albugo candida]